jgi:hypothetical protein
MEHLLNIVVKYYATITNRDCTLNWIKSFTRRYLFHARLSELGGELQARAHLLPDKSCACARWRRRIGGGAKTCVSALTAHEQRHAHRAPNRA